MIAHTLEVDGTMIDKENLINPKIYLYINSDKKKKTGLIVEIII